MIVMIDDECSDILRENEAKGSRSRGKILVSDRNLKGMNYKTLQQIVGKNHSLFYWQYSLWYLSGCLY